MPKKVGVLISGSGTNLQALIDACSDANFPAKIACVISNKADAYGLTRAETAGIPTEVINHKEYDGREAFDRAVNEKLESYGVEIVCLAGFMRLLSPWFAEKWEGSMLNIHPSLLPDFKGANAHRDVIAAKVDKSGCTVHYVVPEMDAGPIIIQAEVPVYPDDTEETLKARVLVEEHKIYPQALRWLAEDKLEIKDGKVLVN